METDHNRTEPQEGGPVDRAEKGAIERTPREESALRVVRPMPLVAPAVGAAAWFLSRSGRELWAGALLMALATFGATLFWSARRLMSPMQRAVASAAVAILTAGALLLMTGN